MAGRTFVSCTVRETRRNGSRFLSRVKAVGELADERPRCSESSETCVVATEVLEEEGWMAVRGWSDWNGIRRGQDKFGWITARPSAHKTRGVHRPGSIARCRWGGSSYRMNFAGIELGAFSGDIPTKACKVR